MNQRLAEANPASCGSRAKLGVAIVQKIATAVQKTVASHRHVSSHLLHPFAVRRQRDTGDADLSRRNPHEHQHVVGRQSASRPNFRREEIHGRQRFKMRADELLPRHPLSALRCRRQVVPLEDVRHGLVADFVAQIADGTHNPPVAPTPILPGKLQHQFFDLRRRRRTAHRRSVLRAVELHGNEFTVPTKNGLVANNLRHFLQRFPAKSPANFGQIDSLRIREL